MNLEAWVKESWDCDPGWIWELGQLGSLSHCQELCGLGQVTFGFLFYKMWGWDWLINPGLWVAFSLRFGVGASQCLLVFTLALLG